MSRPSKPSLVKDKNPPVQIKVFKLAFADADTLADELRTALQQGKATISIVPDRRTNQIVITGGAEDLLVAEALAQKLDVEAPERPQVRRNVSTGTTSAAGNYQAPPPAGVNTSSGNHHGRPGFRRGRSQSRRRFRRVWHVRRRPADSAAAVVGSAVNLATALAAVVAAVGRFQSRPIPRPRKNNCTTPMKRRKKRTNW